MTDNHHRYYLRMEPLTETRKILRVYQDHLADTCRRLRLTPRLTRAEDLHWTALFLDSAQRWQRCLKSLRIAGNLSASDLYLIASTARAAATTIACEPTTYDIFFTGRTSAVLVVRLDGTDQLVHTMIEMIRSLLQQWENNGRFLSGMTTQLFASDVFPLAREQRDKKAHVTIARVRVRPDRQRDVTRSIHSTMLISRKPLIFSRCEVRRVSDRISATTTDA